MLPLTSTFPSCDAAREVPDVGSEPHAVSQQHPHRQRTWGRARQRNTRSRDVVGTQRSQVHSRRCCQRHHTA